jgi:hypothetical protein
MTAPGTCRKCGYALDRGVCGRCAFQDTAFQSHRAERKAERSVATSGMPDVLKRLPLEPLHRVRKGVPQRYRDR